VRGARRPARKRAPWVYAAALDIEERASQVYADLIRRAGDLVRTEVESESDLVAPFFAEARGD